MIRLPTIAGPYARVKGSDRPQWPPSSIGRSPGESKGVEPALCEWYDYFYAPIACGFVAANDRYRIPGYGRSPCAAWQIPLDPIGCAALPRNRNPW